MSQKRKMLRLKDLKDIFNFDNFFQLSSIKYVKSQTKYLMKYFTIDFNIPII
jgi:hypothetical protein